PVLIPTTGIILSGFGPWRLAVFESREHIECIEYEVSEDESLQFILSHHRSRRGWNNFVRIRLALRLDWSPICVRRHWTTCAQEESTRVRQICRTLSGLMCDNRSPQ